MNQGTKQRIVGTVVLLALALIFLPIIFDGQGSYQAPLASRIPEQPVISILPDPTPVRPVLAIDNPPAEVAETSVDTTDTAAPTTDEQAPDSDPPDAATSPATDTSVATSSSASAAIDEALASVTESTPAFSREVPELDANGLPQGWSVRLGSFADGNNAASLVQRLQAAGYRAYTRRLPGSGAGMTGVFVGPWLDRELVSDYQQQLQDEFQLSGLVVRYEVEQLPD